MLIALFRFSVIIYFLFHYLGEAYALSLYVVQICSDVSCPMREGDNAFVTLSWDSQL
jgi:hypothetical protein